MKEYYDTRAPEYDEWYLGLGRFAARERPGWHEAVARARARGARRWRPPGRSMWPAAPAS